MSKGHFEPSWNLLFDLKDKDENPFKGQRSFPLFTKRAYNEYFDDKDMRTDTTYFRIPTEEPNDATAITFVGTQGTGKTRVIKRIAYYYYHRGFNVIVFDLKGTTDWAKINDKRKISTRLHPDEITDYLPVYCRVPSFCIHEYPENMRKSMIPGNLPISSFARRDLLELLEFGGGAIPVMIENFKKGKSPEQTLKDIAKLPNSELAMQSKRTIMARFRNMMEIGFFTNKNILDIPKALEERKVVAIGFGDNYDKMAISTYFELLMKQIKAHAETVGKNQKYLVIVDDADIVVNRKYSPTKYVSVATALSSLTKWRFLGINMCYATQSPSLLNEEIYNNTKHLFISMTGSVNVFRDYVYNTRVLDSIENLDYRPSEGYNEYVWVLPDKKTFIQGYPYNCVPPH